MSLWDCILNAVGAGEMDGARAQQVLDLAGDLEDQLRPRMSPLDAQRRAGDDAIAAVVHELMERRRRLVLQRATANTNVNNVRGFRSGSGADVALGVRDTLQRFSQGRRFGDVESRIDAVRGRARGKMAAVLNTFKRNIAGGLRERKLLDDVVDERFGRDTGNAEAKNLAQAVDEGFEYLRTRFNAAGGRIPKRQDWGMPTHWDPVRVRKATFAQFRKDLEPLLARDRMLSEQTGLPFHSEEAWLEALESAYRTIRTDGWSKIEPKLAITGKSLANRRLDHRFLVFKDGAAWRKAQDLYGSSDAFSTMVGHIDAMSRDVALMEIFGPNPRAGLEYMIAYAQRAAADASTGDRDLVERYINEARLLYEHHTGTLQTPVNARFARNMAGTRDFLISAQLGSAALAAITDVNFQRITRQFNGIPQAGMLRNIVRQMNPASSADRELAMSMGIVLENGIRIAAAQARYVFEATGPEWAKRLSDGVLRASLLSPWTDAGRATFGLDFFKTIASQRNTAWDKLNGRYRDMWQRHGVTAEQWDLIRSSPTHVENGVTFIRPDDVAARVDIEPGSADKLASRVLEIMQTEQEFAVPSSSALGRIQLVTERPGTWAGEIQRSTMMYKNFAATLYFSHIRRGIERPGGWTSKAGYLADLLITTTLLGAASVQLREIAKGRDPRDMTDPGFIAQAVIQGGGLFILGDIVWGSSQRGRGLVETVAGPVVGFAGDVLRLAVGNLADVSSGDPTNIGAELMEFAKRYTPGGNIWYARQAWERLVINQLQKWVDPAAERRFRGEIRRAQDKNGQGFWWAPGQTAPGRPPSADRMFGGR